MQRRHQPWCNVIFFFESPREETLSYLFFASFRHQIYRQESAFILIRYSFGHNLNVELYSAPCLVFVEFYLDRSLEHHYYNYLERKTMLLVEVPKDVEIVSILYKFPRLEISNPFLPGVVPTMFDVSDIRT